jgi:hypothetical protein
VIDVRLQEIRNMKKQSFTDTYLLSMEELSIIGPGKVFS